MVLKINVRRKKIMSLVRKVKLLALVSILTMASMTTVYAKTDNKQDKTVKQTTTATKQEQESKDKSFKRVKEVLGDLALYVEEPEEGTAQYCFDNKLPLDQITAENCTKRLTQDEWYKLLPHTKGADLSYAVEHVTPVVIHMPNIDSNWTSLHDGSIMTVWKNDAYDKVAFFSLTGSIQSCDVYTYFKDGTYKNIGNIPKDKDLDDISFITFPILTKDDNPLQILLFPDHIEQTLIVGKDGVQLFDNK